MSLEVKMYAEEENLDKTRPRCCADVVIRYQWINNQRTKKTFGRKNDRLLGDCSDVGVVDCVGRADQTLTMVII